MQVRSTNPDRYSFASTIDGYSRQPLRAVPSKVHAAAVEMADVHRPFLRMRVFDQGAGN